MPKPEKVQAVRELQEKLSKCTIVITTQYRGIPVNEMTKVRRELRTRGLEYKVVKNTLALIAAKEAGRADLAKIIEGPTAIALGYGDVVEAAKAVTEYIRTSKVNLVIKGAITDSRVLTPEEVQALSVLPRKEVLIAQLTGLLHGPLYALVGNLKAPLYSLAHALEARAKQLESEGQKVAPIKIGAPAAS